MIDTHTHLYFQDFGEEINEIMTQAIDDGVSAFVLPNVDGSTLPLMKMFNNRFPQVTYMAAGIHPTEIKQDWEKEVEFIGKELETGKYIAVGEVGLDLYWDKSYINFQKRAFEKQMQQAELLQLPVIIHSRDALDDTLEIIKKVNPTVPLIFHSFTGNIDDVIKIRKVCDPYFGINGVVTYKNAPELREALPEIGIEKILLETDSPYLTPVPHRGKKNNSSYLKYIRDKIADTLLLTPQEVESVTDINAKTLFRI